MEITKKVEVDHNVGSNVTYASGDVISIGRKGANVAVLGGLSPVLSSAMSTANSMTILTGVIRLLGHLKGLGKKPKGENPTETLNKKTTEVGQKAITGLGIALSGVEMASGAVSTASSITSLVAIKTAAKAAVAALPALSGASSGIGVALYTFMAAPHAIKVARGLEVLEKIKTLGGLEKLKTENPELLKLVAPSHGLTGDLEEVKKEIQGNSVFSVLLISTCILCIVGTALGLAFAAGPGLIVACVVGLVATLAMSGIDGYCMVQALKNTSKLHKKDLIIKIITIALALTTLAISVVFAPTLALQILAGVVGAIMVAVPITSIALLKAKEEKVKAAHQKKIEQQRSNEAFEQTKKENPDSDFLI